jgi:hypothetical protein
LEQIIMARPVKSVTDMVNAWSTGMGGASANYIKGTSSVTEAPTAAAARAVGAYQAGVNRAVADGSYVRGCNNATLSDWQAACRAKAGNLATGAMLSKPKYQAAAQTLASAAQQIRDAVAQMPKGGSANAAARSAAAVAIMKKAFGKSD